ALLAQARIETLDVRVLNRLARFDELQQYAMLVGPLVEHRERAEVASADQAVVNEVDCPGLIRRHWSLTCHPQMAQPLAPAAPSQRQPFFPVQPFDPLVVNSPAFTPDELVDIGQPQR